MKLSAIIKTATLSLTVAAVSATLITASTSSAQAQRSLENGIRCVLNYPGVGRSIAVARVRPREPFCSGISCNLNDTGVLTVRRNQTGQAPEITVGSITLSPPFGPFFVHVKNPVTNTLQGILNFSEAELRAGTRKPVDLRVPVETRGRVTCRFRRG